LHLILIYEVIKVIFKLLFSLAANVKAKNKR